MTPNRGPVPLGGAAATAAEGPTPTKHNSMTLSSHGWCPGPDDGSLAETYESQCDHDASVGRLQHLSARRSQSLRCTSVTKLAYTPRHCFVTQCNKTVLCHAAYAGAHVIKLFPAHLSIIPHDAPRHRKTGRHTLSDLRAKRLCPFSPSLVLSLSRQS